jgi:hypothetical protein
MFDFVATPGALDDHARRAWAALADGALIKPPIERWSLDAAAQADARLEPHATTGALVLVA